MFISFAGKPLTFLTITLTPSPYKLKLSPCIYVQFLKAALTVVHNRLLLSFYPA